MQHFGSFAETIMEAYPDIPLKKEDFVYFTGTTFLFPFLIPLYSLFVCFLTKNFFL